MCITEVVKVALVFQVVLYFYFFLKKAFFFLNENIMLKTVT